MSDIDEKALEDKIVKILADKKMSVSTAESCTGGLVAGRLINVPGASDVFNEGFVTYANEAKRKYAGVSKKTLKKYGAVSKECAKEMAKGVAKTAGADAAIATTGIAGPGGGTEEKPVGLVYIACFYKGKTKVKEYRFEGTRQEIRNQSADKALKLLYKCLIKDEGNE